MQVNSTKTGISFWPVAKQFGEKIHDSDPIFQIISATKVSSQKPPVKSKKFQSYGFFHWWILFGYYSFCFPYKPVVEQNGICRLKSNKAQKIICLLGVWFLTLISVLSFSIKSVRVIVLSNNPKVWDYFHVLLALLVIVRYGEFFRIIITKQKAIEKLLGIIQSSTLVFPWKTSNQKTPAWAKIAYANFVLIHIANFSEMILRFVTSSTGLAGHSVPSFFEGAVAKGRARFFFDSPETNLTLSFSTEDIAFGVTELALNIGLISSAVFVQTLSYGPLPLTFCFAVKGFINMVSDLSTVPTKGQTVEGSQYRILEQYANLKMINAKLNSLWSGILLPHIIYRTLEIVGVHKKIIARNRIGFAIFAFQTGYMAAAVIIMAEGCKAMKRFKTWLVDREGGRKYFSDRYELNMLLREIDEGTVGVGSLGVYQINYGFLSHLVVLAVTLFVIGFN